MKRIKQFFSSDAVYITELLFKIVYILHLLFCFNPYIEFTPVTKITLACTMALGGLLLFCRALTLRSYCRTPGLLLLVLFIISFAIPSLLIYRYALIDSVKTIVWMTFQFGLLFAFDSKKNSQRAKKELGIVSAAVASFVTLENLISVIMAFIGFFYIYKQPDGSSAVTGLSWWGRLYGIHSDPNYACVYTVAVIMILTYFFFKYRTRLLRTVFIVAAFINFMFIVFSASRTGLVTLLVSAFVFAISYFIGHFKEKRMQVLKSVAAALAICLAIVGLNFTTVKGFNAIKPLLPTIQFESITGQIDVDNNNIGRTEEELNGDITNRRTDIWGSALQIFVKNKIFGIGFENTLGYAHDEMPTTYIVNNDLTDFDAFHNTIMDVLVSQGIIGILLAATFAILFIIYCFKRMRYQYSAHHKEICLCLAICISTLASAMFVSHIFYVNIATTAIFWLFAGYLGYFLCAE